MQDVDVVIDQLLTGSYGVTAVEAMISGCAVIGNVSDFVREHFDDEVPILDATPVTLEKQVLQLIDPEFRSQIQMKGAIFAKKFHDGRYSASVLSSVIQ